MHKAGLDDTIVAISTPVGEGGIGIVRLSGPESLSIADRIFVPADGKKPSTYPTYTVHYGRIVDPGPAAAAKSGKRERAMVDEVILTVMRAPKSYTREDIVEINCHGGLQAVKNVLECVVASGARLAEPGEFTKRAFLNGRIDLSQAEAVLDVIRAKTERSLAAAVDQLEGGLSKRVNELRDEAIDIAAHVEASIDFPDEDIAPAERRGLARRAERIACALAELVATYDEGAVLREGVLAIICGKPNVGKSSLMNLLLKRDRVIVSPIPGTTRDAVEEMINLKGIPIRLVDTAGIIETKDFLEREGIARSKKYLGQADIAVVMLDYSAKLDAADRAIIKMVGPKKKVVVVNKCDLARKIDRAKVEEIFRNDTVLEISVEQKKNIGKLEKAIADLIWQGGFSRGEGAIVSNARHKVLLDKARKSMLSVRRALQQDTSPDLVAIDLKEAIDDLGLIIGKTVSEEILNRIFAQFCIGK